MIVRPLRWWNEHQLEQLAGLLTQEAGRWCAGWGLLPPLSEDIKCGLAHDSARDDSSFRAASTSGWHMLSEGAADDEQVWLRADSDPETAIFKAMFGAPVSSVAFVQERNDVAMQVSASAWMDWCTCLRQLFTPEAVLAAKRPVATTAVQRALPACQLKPWSGAVTASLPMFGINVILHLAPQRVAAMLSAMLEQRPAPQQPPKEKLMPLQLALDSQRVRLRVSLESMELEIGTIQSLQPGDVVRLTHPLDQPLGVDVEDQSALCMAYLGRLGHMRAVELMHAAPRAQTTK